MKVEVKIHESIVGQVKVGQKAHVVLDSLPDKRFQGKVTKIAILPDSDRSWQNPDLKVYSTEVIIEETLANVNPGVSARAEILIEELKDVLIVPIQAVTTLNGDQVCYLKGKEKPVVVEVGLFNNQIHRDQVRAEARSEGESQSPLDPKVNLTGEIVSEGSVEKEE